MEKSQQGLLQSLLYDILGNCPLVLPKLFPDRWASPNHAGINMDGSWSQAELLAALNQLTKEQILPGKFIFFIDGVDEYMGDPSEIARLLKAFAKCADVKLIVSSRPWTDIKTFLNPIPGQSLTLQDFTREDIKHYIHELITEHPGFRNTQIDNYNNLIAEIGRKSEGVFLWVVFAVREILKGLTNEDSISELEARLQDIPPGLEEFFQRILNSIEKRYRPQTSQILRMCLAANHPLPLLTFSFLKKEQDNPNYAISEKIIPWTTDHMEKELETLKKRVNARCRDFLQIVSIGQPMSCVEFLHRTVRDFFSEHRNQARLHDWIQYPYNPHLSLCRSFAMQMKVLPVGKSHPKHLIEPITSSLYHAARTDTSCGPEASEIIEEIDRIVNVRKSRYREDNFLGHFFGFSEDDWERGSILAIAVQNGNIGYVRQKLQENPALLNQTYGGHYLLFFALIHPNVALSRPADEVISMVRMLLEAGANPNQHEEHVNFSHKKNRDGTSIPGTLTRENVTSGLWATFLQIAFSNYGGIFGREVRTESFRLLLDHGADLSVKLVNDREHEPLQYHSVSEYLEKMLPDSVECYNILLEHMRKNESRNTWSGILKRRFKLSNILSYISGVETGVLSYVVHNIIIIALEML